MDRVNQSCQGMQNMFVIPAEETMKTVETTETVETIRNP